MTSTTRVDEQLIAELFDIQPDSVVWFVPVFENEQVVDFEAVYGNEAAAHILRTSKANVSGQRLSTTTLMDATSRSMIFEQCLQVWQQGTPIEYTYYSPGFDKYFRVQRGRVRDGILSITRDRTEEVKSELQLKEQTKLLDSIIDNSPNGIALYKSVRSKGGEIIDFRLLLGNQRSAELTGFSLDELYNSSVKELMQVRGHSSYFDICKRVVETKESTFLEYYSTSRKTWLAFSIVPYDDGYLLNYMDITRTKEQAERLNGILEASINGIMALEGIRNEKDEIVDLQITQVNGAFSRILGLKGEDVVGKSYLTVFPHSKEIGVFDLHKQALLTGAPIEHEFFYDGEGLIGWYRLCISRMGANSLVQTFADITENVRAKQQLEATVEQLRISNERLSHFSHIASHDLKEPLRKIMIYSDMILEQGADILHSTTITFLQRIQATADRMQALINDLLSFAQASTQPQHLRPVALPQVLQEVMSDLEPIILESGAAIELDTLPTINGDSRQLGQLFQNLLSNALKFRKEGESPRIIFETTQLPADQLPEAFKSRSRAATYYCIRVKDNGIGFAPEYRERIFELFQRLHANSDYEGTGIGLAIVAKVMENHHGFIEANASAGAGATFSLYFPVEGIS